MEDPIVEQQIDDLRERMRLLQGDRRANIEIIQANKDANKDEIKRLRDENKELRVKISQIQRSGEATGPDGDIDHLRHEVIKLREEYDKCKLATTKNKRELQQLKDEVKGLELEAKRPNQEDSPLTRNIRMLENRLDKAMIKYNEAQSIRKTYEQIVKRLKEERIGFDSQLAALERTFGTKQRDYEELLLLSGDANHAREVASQELERVKAGYEEERRRREAELREKHQELALRRQTQDLLQKRERMQQAIKAEEEGGEMDEGNGGESLRKAAAVNAITATMISQERLEQKNKIDIFEQAFRKIKDATGVSDVNEVIQKIISQEGTTENLMLLTKENQAKIEQLNDTKGAMKARVEEVKYSGPGGGHRRKMVDDHEEQLTSAATRLERGKLKYERLAKMLISIKAGVKHLQDKLAPVREDLGGRELDLTDETVVAVLVETERMALTLTSRMKAARAEELVLSRSRQMASGGGESQEEQDEALIKIGASIQLEEVDEGALQARPHNQRIELPSMEDDWDADPHAMAGDMLADVDGDEELTRDKVKKASHQLMSQQEKKKKKPKKRRD